MPSLSIEPLAFKVMNAAFGSLLYFSLTGACAARSWAASIFVFSRICVPVGFNGSEGGCHHHIGSPELDFGLVSGALRSSERSACRRSQSKGVTEYGASLRSDNRIPSSNLHISRTFGPVKSFRAAKIFFPETGAKTSRSSAQRRRSQPNGRTVLLLPLIASGNPPAAHSIGRRFHVQAYCSFVRRCLRRTCSHCHDRCARKRAREDRHGRRRRDVPLQEHHPECREFQGSHHAGCGGEGR